MKKQAFRKVKRERGGEKRKQEVGGKERKRGEGNEVERKTRKGDMGGED